MNQRIWPGVMNENTCKMGTKKNRTMKAAERAAVNESTLPGRH
jgi:hypothetical protein